MVILRKDVSFQKSRAAEPGRVIPVEEKVLFSGQPVGPKEQVFWAHGSQKDLDEIEVLDEKAREQVDCEVC